MEARLLLLAVMDLALLRFIVFELMLAVPAEDVLPWLCLLLLLSRLVLKIVSYQIDPMLVATLGQTASYRPALNLRLDCFHLKHR